MTRLRCWLWCQVSRFRIWAIRRTLRKTITAPIVTRNTSYFVSVQELHDAREQRVGDLRMMLADHREALLRTRSRCRAW